jgi:hypothetical protein
MDTFFAKSKPTGADGVTGLESGAEKLCVVTIAGERMDARLRLLAPARRRSLKQNFDLKMQTDNDG